LRRTARAKVTTSTVRAPFLRSADAAAAAVEPVDLGRSAFDLDGGHRAEGHGAIRPGNAKVAESR